MDGHKVRIKINEKNIINAIIVLGGWRVLLHVFMFYFK